MKCPVGIAALCLTLFNISSDGLGAQSIEPVLPLKVVPRTRPLDGYMFDRPALVLLTRVLSRTEEQHVGIDEMPEERTNSRFWTYVTAQIEGVIRVNERTIDQPDLKDSYLRIEQQDRRENPIRLEFGRVYLLLLNISPHNQTWDPSQSGVHRPPWYAPAVPQGGFDIVNGRLRPLVKGGPLDAYSGRLLVDVIKEMRERR